jgi:Skp family chaperone for outer membrane proteins
VALSYAELDVAYRAALRRIVQVTAQRDQIERRLLVEQARHTRSAQKINEDLERLHRERQQQQVGNETERIAHEARPAISLTD